MTTGLDRNPLPTCPPRDLADDGRLREGSGFGIGACVDDPGPVLCCCAGDVGRRCEDAVEGCRGVVGSDEFVGVGFVVCEDLVGLRRC